MVPKKNHSDSIKVAPTYSGPNVDPNTDKTGTYMIKAEGWSNCQQACRVVKNCEKWTWVESHDEAYMVNRCYMKTSNVVFDFSLDAVGYVSGDDVAFYDQVKFNGGDLVYPCDEPAAACTQQQIDDTSVGTAMLLTVGSTECQQACGVVGDTSTYSMCLSWTWNSDQDTQLLPDTSLGRCTLKYDTATNMVNLGEFTENTAAFSGGVDPTIPTRENVELLGSDIGDTIQV